MSVIYHKTMRDSAQEGKTVSVQNVAGCKANAVRGSVGTYMPATAREGTSVQHRRKEWMESINHFRNTTEHQS